MYPRGARGQPLLFNGPDRTGSAFYYWATRNIPHNVKKIYHLEDIPGWIEEVRQPSRLRAPDLASNLLCAKNKDAPRAVLLNQGKHIPLLWQTLGNKYKDQLTFAIHRDRYGRTSEKMGFEKGEPGSGKVLIYPEGSTDYVRYEGTVITSLSCGTII